jgi:RNA polymerase sigma factor (sigma-70 family)
MSVPNRDVTSAADPAEPDHHSPYVDPGHLSGKRAQHWNWVRKLSAEDLAEAERQHILEEVRRAFAPTVAAVTKGYSRKLLDELESAAWEGVARALDVAPRLYKPELANLVTWGEYYVRGAVAAAYDREKRVGPVLDASVHKPFVPQFAAPRYGDSSDYQDALAALPPEEREVMTERWVETPDGRHKTSKTEAAERLGITPGEVDRREKSALNLLSVSDAEGRVHQGRPQEEAEDQDHQDAPIVDILRVAASDGGSVAVPFSREWSSRKVLPADYSPSDGSPSAKPTSTASRCYREQACMSSVRRSPVVSLLIDRPVRLIRGARPYRVAWLRDGAAVYERRIVFKEREVQEIVNGLQASPDWSGVVMTEAA